MIVRRGPEINRPSGAKSSRFNLLGRASAKSFTSMNWAFLLIQLIVPVVLSAHLIRFQRIPMDNILPLKPRLG